MNSIPLISNVSGVNFSMNRGNTSPEVQMRQEINTSLVALKKEAGTLEGLINEAAQMLVTINNRIATLENDTVKKSDVVDVVQSGNLQPVTSNAVAGAISNIDYIKRGAEITGADLDSLSDTEISVRKVRNYNIGWGDDDGLVIHIPWSTQFAVQIAIDEQSNFMAKRIKDSGVWKDWVILYHRVNDDATIVSITNDVTKNLGVTQVNAKRINNLVYLYFFGDYTGQPTNSAQNLISGLPLKYRPRSKVEGLCVLGYSNSQFTTAGRIMIGTDGNILLQETAWVNGTQIRAGVIYFI